MNLKGGRKELVVFEKKRKETGLPNCANAGPNDVTSGLLMPMTPKNLYLKKRGETDRKVRLLCHRQLEGLEKCFSTVGRWAKRRRR
jgi:hypothetical protein